LTRGDFLSGNALVAIWKKRCRLKKTLLFLPNRCRRCQIVAVNSLSIKMRCNRSESEPKLYRTNIVEFPTEHYIIVIGSNCSVRYFSLLILTFYVNKKEHNSFHLTSYFKFHSILNLSITRHSTELLVESTFFDFWLFSSDLYYIWT
jgi:hypothetical protein